MIEPIDGTTSESEIRNNILDWDNYRRIVDGKTDGSRKIGLLGKEKYEKSLRDPRSLFVVVEGFKLPGFVPIEYAEGYDEQRTREFVINPNTHENQQIYYYCLPPGLLGQEELTRLSNQLQELLSQETIIFFDYNEHDSLAKSELESIVSNLEGTEISSIPLFEPNLGIKDKQASLGLFVASTHRVFNDEERYLTNNSISEEFDFAVSNGEFEKYPYEGPTILTSKEIGPELRSQMWQIYINRFRDLGRFHPITMEDSIEGFNKMLDNPNTACSINFKNGSPVCWMAFLNDVDTVDWLNSKFFTKENLQISPNEELLFFPEIAAKDDDVGNYSEATLALAAKMVARTKKNYKVVFESTNLSRQYIPRLVEEYVEKTKVLKVDRPIEVDRQLYACYRLKPV